MSTSKKKALLIDVARKLFAQKGLNGTTMNDIANESGISRRTLYVYFSNKEEIYSAVIETEIERLSDKMDEVASRDIDPELKVATLIYTHLNAVKEADVCCYLPFDTMLNAKKFIRIAKPKMAFFIKYEFWQNYITELHRHNIPTYSVASIFRPNQIFFRWYGHKYRNVLKCFTHLFVQNQQSVNLLKRLDIDCATVVGDTRMDRVLQIRQTAKSLPLCEAFCQEVSANSHIIVAGSSWQPDEDILIDYFNNHSEQHLILAPHVVSEQHLAEIESKLRRPSVRYSKATAETAAQAHCLIIDCYGLLSSIYRYDTVAYVGGGFGAGIHNVPEAAVYGVPVIIGPNNQRFREARELIKEGGCFEIRNSQDYISIITHLTTDTPFLQHASQISHDYICANAGAVDKIYNSIFQTQ